MEQPVIVVCGRDPLLLPGGMESFARAYGRAAIRAGYEPHHFCVGTETRVEQTPFGVLHVQKSPFRPLRGIMMAAHGPIIARSIDRFVGDRGVRWLIHSLGPWTGVGADAARRLGRRGIDSVTVATPYSTCEHETRAKVRGVTNAHGWWTKLKLILELHWVRLTVNPSECRGVRQAKLVAVNYDSVREIIRAAYGGPVRFAKIPYASEMAFVRAENERVSAPEPLARLAPLNAPLIVSVARHDARKGIDVLLRALARLRESGQPFRACLVGGGLLLEHHRAYAAKLGLREHVVITGRVPDVYAYLKHADIFVLPSIEEGSGSVALLEAMQAGVAPIVSRVDGLPEDVADGDSALMVEPGDDEGLARALRRLIGDEALRRRLSQRAYDVYRQRFSADAFCAGLRETYTGLGFPPSRRDGAGAEAARLK